MNSNGANNDGAHTRSWATGPAPGHASGAAGAGAALGAPLLVRHLAYFGGEHESAALTARGDRSFVGDVVELVGQLRQRIPEMRTARDFEDHRSRQVAHLGRTLITRNAAQAAVNPVVVLMFALFHHTQATPPAGLADTDEHTPCGLYGHGFAAALLLCRMQRDDDGHGPLRRLLGADELPLLTAACALHDGMGRDPFATVSRSATIGVCWDASRLLHPSIDTGVNTSYLSTPAAREPAMLAHARALPATAMPSWAKLARAYADLLDTTVTPHRVLPGGAA